MVTIAIATSAASAADNAVSHRRTERENISGLLEVTARQTAGRSLSLFEATATVQQQLQQPGDATRVQ
ncbi:hypothetical protein [Nocardia sp. NPDC051570]|uniref:hypothetical protein n=1 Tax=Nocardia sp. NPDC051570 TaxID=3364324 RepID=UPI003793334A